MGVSFMKIDHLQKGDTATERVFPLQGSSQTPSADLMWEVDLLGSIGD